MLQEFGTAIIFITHDLGVVASICDRVMVMYAGRKVELSTTANIFKQPRHPYTMGLLNSAPRWDQGEDELQAIEGQPPDLLNLPTGCSFNPRCHFVQDECLEQTPPLITLDEQPVHQHACLRDVSHLKENR